MDGTVKDLDLKDTIFYKEDPYPQRSVREQRLIITYSPKYAAYQRKIRENQVERAERLIENGKVKNKRRNENDPARFIRKISTTSNGEVADETSYSLNEERIKEE